MKSRNEAEGNGASRQLKAKTEGQFLGKVTNAPNLESSKLFRKMAMPAVLFRFSVKWRGSALR